MRAFRTILTLVVVALALGACDRSKPKADYSKADTVLLLLGKNVNEQGLRRVAWSDEGILSLTTVSNQPCYSIRAKEKQKDTFLYLAVDPTFRRADATNVSVSLEYFDATQGTFELQFDCSNTNARKAGPYTPSRHREILNGTRQWRTTEFKLRNLRLANSQNGGADFRLKIGAPEFLLKSVSLTRDDPDLMHRTTFASAEVLHLGKTNFARGMVSEVSAYDGKSAPMVINGVECRSFGRTPNLYMYVRLERGAKPLAPFKAKVEIEYFDMAAGDFELEYDSWDEGPYVRGDEPVKLRGDRQWHTAEFLIMDARFENRGHAGADFRLSAHTPAMAVRKITVWK